MFSLPALPADRPVLIAGPTASGKSALALQIAETSGGVIVNADALQVFSNWSVLTARPDAKDLSRALHALYGHVGRLETYSVGHWLRDLKPLLEGEARPIIVGGTGLYFRALTEGLADIPPVPMEVRVEADSLDLDTLAQGLDARTRQGIDLRNRARVQRAWEVLRATGRSLTDWQAQTPPPLLPLSATTPLVVDAPKEWLAPRIERRFDTMLESGALEEAWENALDWDPARPSAKAIGAPELVAHLQGRMTIAEARAAAIISTRQYAKRQRTWFRARMSNWTWLRPFHEH